MALPIPKVPEIAGFYPLPNATAAEFMALQGGLQGMYFQGMGAIAKRAVSAMTNKQFNQALTHPDSFLQMFRPFEGILFDRFETALEERSEKLQNKMLDQAYALEMKKMDENFKLFKQFLFRVNKEGIDVTENAVDKLTPNLHDIAEWLGLNEDKKKEAARKADEFMKKEKEKEQTFTPAPTATPAPTPQTNAPTTSDRKAITYKYDMFSASDPNRVYTTTTITTSKYTMLQHKEAIEHMRARRLPSSLHQRKTWAAKIYKYALALKAAYGHWL